MAQASHEDAVVEWPQSGEHIIGRHNTWRSTRTVLAGRRSRRCGGSLAAAKAWFSEQLGDYGGQAFCGSSIFELRDGKIARETDYFGEPFEPPAWRAAWVERAD